VLLLQLEVAREKVQNEREHLKRTRKLVLSETIGALGLCSTTARKIHRVETGSKNYYRTNGTKRDNGGVNRGHSEEKEEAEGGRASPH